MHWIDDCNSYKSKNYNENNKDRVTDYLNVNNKYPKMCTFVMEKKMLYRKKGVICISEG